VSTAAELPPLPAGTVLPASVRNASPDEQRDYRTAMAFERVLIGQLTKAMQATVPGEDDDATAATKTYRELLPGTMADALVAGGGIGLAADLARSLKTGGQ
jgi:Rod binding domain-containing protein